MTLNERELLLAIGKAVKFLVETTGFEPRAGEVEELTELLEDKIDAVEEDEGTAP